MKVGVSVPLTGPAATYGVDLRNIFNFLNDELGQGRFQLLVEDDACDPKQSAAVANRFANVERVKFVLGLPCSGAALSAAPIYERGEVLTISAVAGTPKLSTAGDFIFRTRPTDEQAGEMLNRYITRKHTSLAILVEQTEYALGMRTAFEAAELPENFLMIVEEFPPGTTDLKASVTKLRARRPNAILILPQTEQSLAIAVKQLHDLKWEVPIYSNWVAESRAFVKAVGPMADGIIYATLPGASEAEASERKVLYQKFTEKFGELNSIRGTFECSYNAFAAMKLASESGGEPRATLYRTEIQGYRGKFTFDKFGDIVGLSFVLRVNQGGEPMPVTGTEGSA